MLKVYGQSDDLIEVEGDIREEFNPDYDDPKLLVATSNGVVMRIFYDDDGIWRITILKGHDKVKLTQCKGDDDEDYSDIAVIEDDVDWVVCGNRLEVKR
jgi:hypothetical protein